MEYPWIKITHSFTHPLVGRPILLFKEEFVHPEFCPDGVREGYYDGEQYHCVGWDSNNDEYNTVNDCQPTHWTHMINGPEII